MTTSPDNMKIPRSKEIENIRKNKVATVKRLNSAQIFALLPEAYAFL